ncbi:hypothetical protein [uncultured Thiodictyon sp.]|uniref:hypothetical protein n=1 Tax=uncultured Thiodictyon sp. TaxID=1846217 RepID=UPI0025CC5A07|nr:hypothetical protein [uncultured Thiodictyon sp.]
MTLIADSTGRIAGQFTIPGPNRVTAGAKLVEFTGAVSHATATFVGRGAVTIEELRVVNTTINRRLLTWTGDPLAQTFILDRRIQLAALDLWFTALGTTKVLVQIREVANGVPTLVVVAESLKIPAAITVGTSTRFLFDPTILEANQEYAIVIACNDAVSAVATAALGEFDATVQRWVTSQAYQVGVLLSSSNNRTWTAHQTKDLTFRLLESVFTSTSKRVALDPVTVANADQLIVMAAVLRPTRDTDVVFEVGAGGVTYTVVEGQPFSLPSTYSGEVTLAAILTGTSSTSPVLYRDVQLISGARMATGDYVSRLIQTNIGVAASVALSVYYDAILPGGAAVVVSAEQGDGGTWSTVTAVSSATLEGDWVEYKHALTGFTHIDTRIKLSLTGTAAARPRVRNLRVAII